MNEVAANLPTFQSMRPSLYWSRRKRMPRSRADVHFEGEWTQTIDSKRFLLVEDGDDDKIVIFATDDSLKFLAEAVSSLMEPSTRAQKCSIKSSPFMPSRMDSSFHLHTACCQASIVKRTREPSHCSKRRLTSYS